MKTDVLLVAVLSVVALSPRLGRVTRLPVPTVQFCLRVPACHRARHWAGERFA